MSGTPTPAALRQLIAFLPSLRISEASRRQLTAWLEGALASAIVFEPLDDGRWRIGQGESVGIYADAPPVLAIAYQALQGEDVPLRGSAPDAVRNRLRRAAGWLERHANAGAVADALRSLRVERDRVCGIR